MQTFYAGPAGFSNTSKAPAPPSLGLAWQNAITSFFCTSQLRTLPLSTGSLPTEPLPLPWITRTQRRP
jgi:hypothetical protein